MRSRNRLVTLLFVAMTVMVAGRLSAQDPNAGRGVTEVLESIGFVASVAGSRSTEPGEARSFEALVDSVESRLVAVLTAPQSLNVVLDHLREEPFLNGLLEPLNLEFASLQTEDSGGLWGLQYDWHKDFVYDSISSDGADLIGITAALDAAGMLTDRASLNPRNLIVSGVSIGAFGSWGGTLAGDDALFDRLNALGDALTQFNTVSELEASGEFADFFGEVWSRLSTQLYLSAELTGSLEADQAFDQTQYVIEGRLGVDLKAWRPDSPLAKLNFLDWPAAVLRYLMGADQSFRPSGVAIPTAVVGIGRVEPDKHPTREALGETDPYYRVSTELAYRSPIASMAGGSLYLEGSLRHYFEIGPPSAVEAVGLDRFTLFSVALLAPNGLYASYSTGSLPLDLADSRLYELGFRWTF